MGFLGASKWVYSQSGCSRWSGHVRWSGQVKLGVVRSGHVGSGQVRSWSGQVRSGQVRSGQVRSGQVRSWSGEFRDQVDKISLSEFWRDLE
jgi:hypothetical protein